MTNSLTSGVAWMVLPLALRLPLSCDTLCNLPGHSAVAAPLEETPAHRVLE